MILSHGEGGWWKLRLQVSLEHHPQSPMCPPSLAASHHLRYLGYIVVIVHGKFVIPWCCCIAAIHRARVVAPKGIQVFTLPRSTAHLAVFQDAPPLCKRFCPRCCSRRQCAVKFKCRGVVSCAVLVVLLQDKLYIGADDATGCAGGLLLLRWGCWCSGGC